MHHKLNSSIADNKFLKKSNIVQTNDLQIYVSILDIDFWYLRKIIKLIKETNVNGIHFDVMDGYFVNHISFGVGILKTIADHYSNPIDAHLMLNDPVVKYRKYSQYSATVYFHFESTYYREINNLILDIKSRGRKVGIAISPKTNIEQIYEYCENCDEILIMGVNPGKGGQKFIKKTTKKIKKLVIFLRQQQLSKQVIIAIDGGVNYEIAKICYKQGARKIIIGNSFFNSDNPHGYVKKLRSLS